MKGLVVVLMITPLMILWGCAQIQEVRVEEGAVILGGPLQPEPKKEEEKGEIKPEVVGFYHRIANPGDFLTLKKDGTFFLRQGVRYLSLAPRVPSLLTLAGKWRVTENNTLILDRIITMGPEDFLDSLPLGGFPVLKGVIEEKTIYLDPTIYPSDPPGIKWVKRELC